MFGKLFGSIRKVAKVGAAVSKVVPIPGVAAAEALIQKGTKRFSLDRVGAKKVAKGVGVAGVGAPVGLILMGLVSGYLPDFLLSEPARDATVAVFAAIGAVLVNLVRKFLAEHPDLKAVVDSALDAAREG